MEEITPPVTPAIPETNNSEKKLLHKGLALVVVVLILGASVGLTYWLKTQAPEPTPITDIDTDSSNVNPQVKSFEQISLGEEQKVLVDWHAPIGVELEISQLELFNDQVVYKEVGTFTSGPYKGGKLYNMTLPVEGPCFEACRYLFRIAENPSGKKPYVLLDRESVSLDGFYYYSDSTLLPLDPQKIIIDPNVAIEDLHLRTYLYSQNPRQFLRQHTFEPDQPLDITGLKLVFNHAQVGAVYTDDPNSKDLQGGFYVKSADGGTVIYRYNPDIWQDGLYGTGVPNITWNNGSKNGFQYVGTDVGGCGFSNYISVVSPQKISLQNDLVKAGTTPYGDVYELKNKNHEILKNIYDNKYNPYDSEKVSYNQFLQKHPVFFWFDPFDRLIKFENDDFQPQAECAKPAIYLYPEQTSGVSVKVNPKGGFTYTDPEYGTGWNVTAKPNGEITADGKTYPYLFWEGRGGLYQTPDKGFVVAKAEVHNFLTEKLTKLGLNAKEIADFQEYWEPLMQSSPYYFVTFMGNRTMDELAPLDISPKPDMVIRVLMDFKPLDKPIEVQGFEIRTPVRKGFTVVEWGGVKH